MNAAPVLVVIAGPNGAGKSRFYDLLLKTDPSYSHLPFVNADILAVQHFGHPAETSEEMQWGQAKATEVREECLARGISLVLESTFSHPSKVEMVRAAKNRGFHVVVFHLSTLSPARSQERVDARVEQGGHDVPAGAVEARWLRNGALIRQAILLAHQGFVFDSDVDGIPPRLLANFIQGKGLRQSPIFPEWAEKLYGEDLPQA